MSKMIFRKLIVRGKMCLARSSWYGWPMCGTRWHFGGVPRHMFKQVHGKLDLITWNALICPN